MVETLQTKRICGVTIRQEATGGCDRRGTENFRMIFVRGKDRYVSDGHNGSPLYATDSLETFASAVLMALECARQDGVLPEWLMALKDDMDMWVYETEERLGSN